MVKIVGVSDDPERIANATKSIDDNFDKDVSATSSQTYYLDVTHKKANKGAVVDYLADDLSIDRASIVTIGALTLFSAICLRIRIKSSV